MTNANIKNLIQSLPLPENIKRMFGDDAPQSPREQFVAASELTWGKDTHKALKAHMADEMDRFLRHLADMIEKNDAGKKLEVGLWVGHEGHNVGLSVRLRHPSKPFQQEVFTIDTVRHDKGTWIEVRVDEFSEHLAGVNLKKPTVSNKEAARVYDVIWERLGGYFRSEPDARSEADSRPQVA